MPELSAVKIDKAMSIFYETQPSFDVDVGKAREARLVFTNYYEFGQSISDSDLRAIASRVDAEFEDMIEEAEKQGTQTTFERIAETATEAVNNLAELPLDFFKNATDKLSVYGEKYMDFFVNQGLLDEDSKAALLALGEDNLGQSWVINLLMIIPLLKGYIDVLLNTVGGDFAKKMNGVFTPNMPDPQTAIRGMFIAPEKYDDYYKTLTENGFSEEDITKMIIANYNIYDISTIQTLFLRGDMEEDKTKERLAEHGFTPERVKEIMDTWYVIPSIQDIIYMLSKEAFEPDQIRELGLDAEFPEEAVQWAEKQGLSREWLEKYWYAHWQLPSLQMGFEMLHRDVIDENTLNALFRAQEIPPFWREKLSAISYSPFTRVDIRRMYRDGVVTREQVKRNYLDLGYNEERAELITEWTVKDVEPNQKELTRAQIERGYKDDLLSRTEAENYLKAINYTDTAVEYMLDRIDYNESQALADSVVDGVKKGFLKGVFSVENARQRLSAIDLSADKVNYLISLWTTEREASETLISKSDLFKMFALDIIDSPKLAAELKKHNYSGESVDLLIDLALGGKDES